MKNYKKANYLGSTIDEAVNSLLQYKEKGEFVSCEFNGTMLYSDTVTLDSAYMTITGKTKAECEERDRKWREEYDRKEKEHQAEIPSLAEQWKTKGRSFVKPDKLEL